MSDLHSMDEYPPDHATIHSTSVEVVLHYADGVKAKGYHCGWNGWMVWRLGMPIPCDDDGIDPIGWTLPTKE